VRGPIESPAVVDIIRSLQTQTGNLCPCRQPGRRVGLALSSNHRVYFTSQTIEAMDRDSRFDMIFDGGSEEAEVRALRESLHFQNANLVEVNCDVRTSLALHPGGRTSSGLIKSNIFPAPNTPFRTEFRI
jgi:hypothetical protein